MGDVRQLRPPPGPPPDDPLLSLPVCPIQQCSLCGRHEGWSWCSRDYGCSVCAPHNERAVIEMSHLYSRASSYRDALVRLLRAARKATAGRGMTDLRQAIDLIDANERTTVEATGVSMFRIDEHDRFSGE